MYYYTIRHAPFLPVRGMALFPFILLKYREDLTNIRIIRHEKIHIIQQLEMLVIPFYIFYLLHYALNRLKGQAHHEAYMSICFEKEAYDNDKDDKYIRNRKWWGFLKYL